MNCVKVIKRLAYINKLKPESVGIFQHDGPVVIRRRCRYLVVSVKTPILIVHNIKVIAFTRIIAEPKIEYKIILCIDILRHYTGRDFGVQHIQGFRIDGMNVQGIVGFTVGKAKRIEFIMSEKLQTGANIQHWTEHNPIFHPVIKFASVQLEKS